MPKVEVEIVNKLGLHARASAKLTQLAGSYPCEVWMERNSRRINAKSIMGVMMLAAGKGATVVVAGATPADVEDQPLAVQDRAGSDGKRPRLDVVLVTERPTPKQGPLMQIQAMEFAFRTPGVHAVPIQHRRAVGTTRVVHGTTIGGGIAKGPAGLAGFRTGSFDDLLVALPVEKHQNTIEHNRHAVPQAQGT